MLLICLWRTIYLRNWSSNDETRISVRWVPFPKHSSPSMKRIPPG
jgi:hypothetical protein